MKKIFALIFSLAIMAEVSSAQSTGFWPANGVTVTGSGSESTVSFDFNHSAVMSTVPYSVAAYAKLITENATYYANVSGTDKGTFPPKFEVTIGAHTWTIELFELFPGAYSFEKTASSTQTFYAKHTIYVQNNFGIGDINVDGTTYYSYNKKIVYKFTGENIAVGAIDQTYNGTAYVWNSSGVNNSNWQKKRLIDSGFNNIPGATTRNYNYTVESNDNHAEIQAPMRKICNLSFQNSFVAIGNGGVINVNGSQTNSPTSTYQVVELNPATVLAQNQVINGIDYSFTQWNDGNTSASRTLYPTANASYTANFVGRPNSTYMNTTLNYNESGQQVRLSWNDHPNTNVTQYKVYRGAKVEGNFTNPVVLATLNRGTTSYTDYAYTVGGSNPGSVAYDVVPYYLTEDTWGFVGQNIITASPSGARISTNENVLEQAMASELPTEYSIGNFPNPFNPTTTIKYQLPEAGMVTLKVYDILGREVAELVNETKSAGYYEVNFDAKKLTSGVYIYTIQAGKYTESKKMILTK